MARTKASVGVKVVSVKSSKVRSCAPSSSSNAGSASGSKESSRSHSGGNSVCHRDTPKWQKPITTFFISKDNSRLDDGDNDKNCDDDAGSSNSKPEKKSRPERRSRRNVIESDDEDINPDIEDTTADDGKSAEKGNLPVEGFTSEERPKNNVLDDTIELEPLTGDNSHKLEEYYPKEVKGKGVGKKSNKENVAGNARRSSKRDLEEITFGEEPKTSKRAKVE